MTDRFCPPQVEQRWLIKQQKPTRKTGNIYRNTTLPEEDRNRATGNKLCYSNTTVYYEIHERSECIPVDCGVTNLIHDRRSCVDFTLEVRRMWLDVFTQA